MKKYKLAVLIFSAFLGGALVSGLYIASVRANIFQDFYNQYLKEAMPQTTAPAQEGRGAERAQPYVSAVGYEQAIIEAVRLASPAVASIIISKDLPVIEQCPYSPFSDLSPGFGQFFGAPEGFQFSVPCQKGTKLQEVGGGSGFLISSDGLIVTNKHVVSDENASYTVLANDGKKYPAKVLARDPVRDFAVIKISAQDLPTLALGDSSGVQLGQTAIAIGNALGEYRNTVSVGVISGLAREVTASTPGGGEETIRGVIQSDAAINPGNSGGPLLNLKGEVIGINTAIASGAQNIGFAIPINQVKPAIESVKSTGKIVAPYLGVRYLTVNADTGKREKLSVDYGALLRGDSRGPAVVPGSPADKAGLRAEDIIIEMNGEKIDEAHPLSSLIEQYQSGNTVTLKILRGAQTLSIAVTLGEFPAR